MGQIFNRIKNIAKSYTNDFDLDLNAAENLINGKDDELKRSIDDLNSKSANNNRQNRSNDPNKHYRENSKPKDDTTTMNMDRAYSILEIDVNSSIDVIKSAYKTKMREYHPDKTQNLGKEIQDLANKKTKEINDAYSYLKKVRNFQ
jgi:DnaJ-domain-containing protein 1